MARRIEDYAVIGNCETMALVGCDGSIDWLCAPRFDCAASFAAILGGPQHGRWLIAPDNVTGVTRHYRGDTLILETVFESADGAASVIDFMARREGVFDLLRIVRGRRGTVAMHTELIVRFGYGSIVPWVSRQADGRLQLTAGPDRLLLDTSVALRGEDQRTVGEFAVKAGEEIAFALSWTPSYRAAPEPLRAAESLVQIESFWSDWTAAFKPMGEWADAVLRSY